VRPIFTFRSDISDVRAVCCWLLPCRSRLLFSWWLFALPGGSRAGCRRVAVIALVTGGGAVGAAGRMLGRSGGGERGEGLAAAPAGFRGQAFGGAALVFFLPGVPGCQDAPVADDEQGRDEQHQGGQAHQAAPAAADVVGGGVLGGGEAAFGAGAPGVGAAPGRGRVVVFLRGLGEHVRRDGDGLLGAAGLGVPGGCRISGRSRSSVIDAGRSGQRILPVAAGTARGGSRLGRRW
jgi:hypothetical protein